MEKNVFVGLGRWSLCLLGFVHLLVSASCGNMADVLQSSLDAASGKARLVVSLQRDTRTIMPDDFDFASDMTLSFVLEGLLAGGNTVQLKNWEPDAATSTSAYSAMTGDKSLLVEPGIWNFTLKVLRQDSQVLSAKLIAQTVLPDSTTPLSFGMMKEDYTSGVGNLSVTLTFPADGSVGKVTAALYDEQTDGVVINTTQEFIPTNDTDGSVDYSLKDVAAGTYYLKMELIQKNDSAQIDTYREIVHIAANITSTATRNIPVLRSCYAINFMLTDTQQLTGTWTAGTTVPATFSSHEVMVLPTAQMIEPPVGYVFGGWYEDSTFTGNPISAIPLGTSGNKAFYAKWDYATYTVTLDHQSAKGGVAAVSATYSAQLPDLPELPTRTAGGVWGYYDQPNGQGERYYDEKGKALRAWNNTADGILYAYWVEAEVVSDGSSREYQSIGDALEVAKKSSKSILRLIGPTDKSLDIDEGDFTLDLNGYSISVSSSSSENLYGVKLSGVASLTVTDSSDKKTGAIIAQRANASSNSYRSAAIENNSTGTLTIAGGTLTGIGDGSSIGYGGMGIYNSATKGMVEVTGGKVVGRCISSNSYYSYGIYNYSTGGIKISGGELLSQDACVYNYSSGDVYIENGTLISDKIGIYNKSGEVTMNDGTLECRQDVVENYASGQMYGIESAGGIVTISGGSITVSQTASNLSNVYAYGVSISNACELSITAGTITANSCDSVYGLSLSGSGSANISDNTSINVSSEGLGGSSNHTIGIYYASTGELSFEQSSILATCEAQDATGISSTSTSGNITIKAGNITARAATYGTGMDLNGGTVAIQEDATIKGISTGMGTKTTWRGAGVGGHDAAIITIAGSPEISGCIELAEGSQASSYLSAYGLYLTYGKTGTGNMTLSGSPSISSVGGDRSSDIYLHRNELTVDSTTCVLRIAADFSPPSLYSICTSAGYQGEETENCIFAIPDDRTEALDPNWFQLGYKHTNQVVVLDGNNLKVQAAP